MAALGNTTTNCEPEHLNMNYEHIKQLYSSYVAICVINSLTAGTAVIGNALVIVALLRTPAIQTPSNTLLGCLAVTDFLTGLITQPSFIANKVLLMVENFNDFCSAILTTSASSYILSGTSFLVLTAIGADKFLALKLHLRYNELVTCRRVLITVFCLLVFTASLTTVFYINRPVFNAIAIINILVNFLLQCFAYIKVFSIVKRHRKRIQAETSAQYFGKDITDLKKILRSSNTMIYIVILSVLCYVPFVGVRMAESISSSADHDAYMELAEKFAMTIVFSNSSLNPALYCYRIGSLRQAVLKLLKRQYNTHNVISVAPTSLGRARLNFTLEMSRN